MGIAEKKLVSFCAQVLREASDFQSDSGETTNMDSHLVLELRSPVIVKVRNLLLFNVGGPRLLKLININLSCK